MTVGEARREKMFKSEDCHLIDGIFYYKTFEGSALVLKAESNITHVVIPESITLPNGEKLIVDRIDYIAFANTDIESVVIPKTIKVIERNAFEGCKRLKDVRFHGNIERIEQECFMYCESLETIVLPQIVGKIENSCFFKCVSLKTFTLPVNMTQISSYMFAYCTGLTSIDLQPHVASIGYGSFEGCSGLTKICFKENISSIDTKAFMGCTGLTCIEIRNPELCIDSESFYGCTSLETIVVPSDSYVLEESSFIGCTKINKQHSLHRSEYGDTLKARWKKEEYARKLRENKWYRVWDISKIVFVLILLAPLAIVVIALLGTFAFSFAAVAHVLGTFVLLGIVIIAIWEWITGNSLNLDIDSLLNSKSLLICIFIIALIITIAIISYILS